MIINRKYLKFQNLYGQNEHYMQFRMALMAAKKGDFIYLNHTLGSMIADESFALGMKQNECFSNGFSLEKWDIKIGGVIHYSPEARVMQLKSNLELIEDCCERRDQKLRVIEKWVTFFMSRSLYAVAVYKSISSIKIDGYLGHLHYKNVLEQFKNEMLPFFKEREEKGEYFFSGHLQDIVKNEMLLLEQAKSILHEILASDKIFIYGDGRYEKKLRSLLQLMNIDSELYDGCSNVDCDLMLVISQSNKGLEKDLLQKGIGKVLFMDRMHKYIGIVWCSEHEGQEYWNEYTAYMG